MSIELAEKLKRKLTDQWVVVDPSVPELRRFQNRTGRVKTVNMNGRALVQFDGPADIGWYDIDPAFLTVVDEPVRRSARPAVKSDSARPPATSAAKGVPATDATAKSPLDLVRQQQARTAIEPRSPAVSKPLAATKPGLSVLEQNPWQAPHVLATEVPAEAPPVAPAATLSPLQRIRQQQAAKTSTASTVVERPRASALLEQNPWQAAHVVAAEVGQTPAVSAPQAVSPVERVRQQQAGKSVRTSDQGIALLEQNPWQAAHVVAAESALDAARPGVATAPVDVVTGSALALEQNPWQAPHVIVAESSTEVTPEPAKTLSPIEQIRRQQAARQTAASPPAATPAAAAAVASLEPTPAAPASKLSPIEQIRQQQRARQAGQRSEVEGPASTSAVPSVSAEEKLSPIEIVRRQQAAKKKG